MVSPGALSALLRSPLGMLALLQLGTVARGRDCATVGSARVGSFSAAAFGILSLESRSLSEEYAATR